MTAPIIPPVVAEQSPEQPPEQLPEQSIEPFTGNELNPSNWTLTPMEDALFLCRNSATNREETLSMEDFNALLRG